MAITVGNRREELLNSARSGGNAPDMESMMAGLPANTEIVGSRETTQTPVPGGGSPSSSDSNRTLEILAKQIEQSNSRIERSVVRSIAEADREHNEELLEKNTNNATDAIKEAYANMKSSARTDSQTIGIGLNSGANPMKENLAMQEETALLSVKLQAAGFAPPEGQSGAYQQYGFKPTEFAVDLTKADMARIVS